MVVGPISSIGATKNVTTLIEAREFFMKDVFVGKIVTNINKELKSFKKDFKKHSNLLQSIVIAK